MNNAQISRRSLSTNVVPIEHVTIHYFYLTDLFGRQQVKKYGQNKPYYGPGIYLLKLLVFFKTLIDKIFRQDQTNKVKGKHY